MAFDMAGAHCIYQISSQGGQGQAKYQGLQRLCVLLQSPLHLPVHATGSGTPGAPEGSLHGSFISIRHGKNPSSWQHHWLAGKDRKECQHFEASACAHY